MPASRNGSQPGFDSTRPIRPRNASAVSGGCCDQSRCRKRISPAVGGSRPQQRSAKLPASSQIARIDQRQIAGLKLQVQFIDGVAEQFDRSNIREGEN